jgi:hypothetical protein
MFGGADPSGEIQNHFAQILSLPVQVKERELAEKRLYMNQWVSLRIDLQNFRVSVNMLDKVLAKLKNGKGSPDGITAEMYKALPLSVKISLAEFLTQTLRTLELSDDWCRVFATLLPKSIGACDLSKFRPVACLSTFRKIIGYTWMRMLPPLRFDSFPTAFVPGSHPAAGVFLIKRAAELSKEWSSELYVAQVDLRKAFDRVLHSSAIKALKLQGVSLQCMAFFCAMMSCSAMSFGLGGIMSGTVNMERGLPQGAPESPLVFVMITEMVLRPLLHRWRQRDSGWILDSFWLGAVCYADDILLVSRSKADLVCMIQELAEAFLAVGLEIAADKTHWTSYPAAPDDTLRVGDFVCQWEATLTFVGTLIDLGGNDALAVDHRIAQAEKVYWSWRVLLTCKWIPKFRRAALATRAVFPSALWLSETWNPTSALQDRLASWGARILARTVGVRPRLDDDIGDHWRRRHRVGHALAKQLGGGLTERRLRSLHGWAGHLARSVGPLRTALRTRCLAWWRFFQHPCLPLHSRRFGRPHRWEAQLTKVYGEVAGDSPMDQDYGWMALAQDRSAWRAAAPAFMSQNF